MTFWEILFLAILEAVTEFIPVSSTGHMVLLAHQLGHLETPETQAFIIIVQFFAIVAALWAYKEHLLNLKLWISIFWGFLPTAVLGFWLKKWGEYFLSQPTVVSFGLIIGGIGLLGLSLWHEKRGKVLKEIALLPTPPLAFTLGLFQLLAFWPGFSRSGALILGALCLGYNPVSLRQFIFLLGVPTIGAAALVKLVKLVQNPQILSHNISLSYWFVGFMISFGLSFITIRLSQYWLKTRGLQAFSLYRIIIGLLAWLKM